MPAVPAPFIRRRVILPRFLFGGDGQAGNDDGDDGGGGIILPIVEFEQEPGPFVVPPVTLPPPGGANGPFAANVPVPYGGGTTVQFFNSFSAVGTYNQKYRSIPLDPNLVSCNQATPPAPTGDAHSGAGGVVTRNPATGIWAGDVNLTAFAEGFTPGPGGNAPAIPGLRTGTAWTRDGVLNGIQELGGPIVHDRTIYGITPGSFQEIQTGGREIGAGGGWFVAGFLNTIGCTSMMAFTWSDRYTLITVPSVFGAPARTQHVTGFVPDGAGGGTYAGNASRVRLSFVAPGATAVYFFTYLVTPDDGSPAYRLGWSEQLAVVPGAFTTVVREFPPLAGATVFLESYEVLFNPEQSDDWSDRSVSVFATLAGTGTWAEGLTFAGGGPWDDFENWQNQADTTIDRLDTGYWNGTGLFSSLDGVSAADDFEGYPAGSVLQLNRGGGWPGPGVAGQADPFQGFDDFEAYAAGPITTLPWVVDTFNRWAGDGLLVADQRLMAWDDLESYAVGAIASLPVPADPDNHFGTGTFG